jgi:hypothetical protein
MTDLSPVTLTPEDSGWIATTKRVCVLNITQWCPNDTCLKGRGRVSQNLSGK